MGIKNPYHLDHHQCSCLHDEDLRSFPQKGKLMNINFNISTLIYTLNVSINKIPEMS